MDSRGRRPRPAHHRCEKWRKGREGLPCGYSHVQGYQGVPATEASGEMTTYPSYGYLPVESLVLAFVQASSLIPKDHPAYTDIRQLAEGKRRFYAWLERERTGKKSNAKDLPALANLMKAELAREWGTPEMAEEVARRLSKYITSYLQDFVRAISAANILTSRVQDVLRPTFFAQKIAVDLSWLEQKLGIGLLPRLLPKAADHARVKPIAAALRWIRKLEGQSAADAARKAGLLPEDVIDIMHRWESGSQKTRRDSFARIKELYGMNEKPRYRFWFWIALVLDAAGPAFRQEIAACLGRGFDLDAARAPFIELSNSCIMETGTPEAFLVLDKLLCRQSTTRAVGDHEKATAALEELRHLVAASNGIAEFQVWAMEARIAVFSDKPKQAKKFYERAVALSRYAEPVSAERILREFAALCARESYAIPLKNATDTQWLFGLHPVQIRRMPLDDDETPANATDTKRVFDYYRYFPPQLFFSRAIAPQVDAPDV
ncbi:hypothetical protein BN2497_3781 [Janthinobacterium sp. CG23_2]|nr:hypothetical protein BN2497_3781 [Janthinobacterium sp. CG23_2]CUU28288.1 hypothetical protein BN3177_3781 [Janthinobacterium sp. CG23_2]